MNQKNTATLALKIIGISIVAVVAIWLLIAALNLYSSSKNAPTPTPTPPTYGSMGNKISETAYAGTLMEVNEDKIVVSVDNENYTYFLTERAKNDIKVLNIQANDKIIVNFTKFDDTNLQAESIEKIQSE